MSQANVSGRDFSADSQPSHGFELTSRERDVLVLLAAGLPAHRIATELSLTTRVVDTTWRDLMAKFEARTREQIVANAVRIYVSGSFKSAALAALLDDAHLVTTPDLFLEDVREALQSLRRRLPSQEPSSQLTPGEADVLSEGEFALQSQDGDDPVTQAAAEFTALLASALDVDSASRLLAVTPARVRQMLSQGSLHGIRAGNAWKLPNYQFTDQGVVPNLPLVLRNVPTGIHPLALQRWLTTPSRDLEWGEHQLSPLAWLRSGGDPSRVAEIANGL